jgi:hypothetical protein
MRLPRPFPLIAILLLSLPLLAQLSQQGKTAPPQNTAAPPPAPRDPMATTVVNQALAAAGGINAVSAIQDYSASGNVTYHWQEDVQGTVNIIALGQIAFRIDATLPTGVRSWSIDRSTYQTKNEQGVVMPVRGQIPISPTSLVIPYLHLVLALQNAPYRFTYQGMIQLNGRSVHDVQVAPVFSSNPQSPTNQWLTKDYFIDASTFQIVQTQDRIGPRRIVHTLLYSDYMPQNGVLVPFSITEEDAGQQTWSILLDQVSFNSGLQESKFGL